MFVFLASFINTGCTEEAKVKITDPPRGSMLPAGQEVVVRGTSESDRVTVNGQSISAGGSFEASLPEVDGLGFAVAEISGDPLIATRSYHQGSYLPPHDFHDETIAILVGSDALSTHDTSVAGLISDLLIGEELAGYVDNPLSMTVTIVLPVTITVNVDSVVSPDIVVTLHMEGSDLLFHAHLTNVEVDYTATAVSFSSSGTALYSTMDVNGGVQLSATDVTLTDLVVTTSDPVITDSGGLPAAAVDPLATLLNDEVPPAIESAAIGAADAVFSSLISGIRPEVGLAFTQPIEQDSRVDSVSVGTGGIDLGYGTLIEATSPAAAAADHEVMQRSTSCALSGTGISVSVGSPLVNQLAFAVWDAGNIDGLSFTRSELETMGMESLESPYDRLDHVDIGLLLPPLLEWGDDGPRFDIGGIEVDITVSGAEDLKAWTAASVPVILEMQGEDLRIKPDPSRAVTIREVGFDKMNSLADLDKVMRILDTAVPGVVQRVFGDLPTIVVPSMALTALDGDPGPVVTPRIQSVSIETDCWTLELLLTTD